ncbi:TBC1 domain family member 20-like [Artemia franciscana]|uniref:Rab-GAP TBC domain-containing protein n=1 Tax=Artemia franciscana TaxID=6661 RepID=A0AA88I9L9_ARTSF|nr:hypothetical protein QYM36_001550 [Artemia franciscana]
MEVNKVIDFDPNDLPLDYYSAESDLDVSSSIAESTKDDVDSSGDELTYFSDKELLSRQRIRSDSDLQIAKNLAKTKFDFKSDPENVPPRSLLKKRLKKRSERKKISSVSDNIISSSDDEFEVNSWEDERISWKKISSTKIDAEKAEKIKKALRENPVNLDYLRNAARSEGGLLTDEIRRKVWPRLVGLKEFGNRRKRNLAEIETHVYYHQVVLDVTRVLERFPPGINARQRQKLQEQLTNLIISVLYEIPSSHNHYYQGYHDVAITLLLVLGSESAFHVLKKLSLTHLCEFMRKTMEPTTHLLNIVPCILQRTNPELFDHLERASLGTIFCLPWVITWFGHEVREYGTLLKIYDYLIASPPLAPIYLSAAFVSYMEDELLEEECDMAMLHHKLSKLPSLVTNWQQLFGIATKFYCDMPPKIILEDVEDYLAEKKMKEEEYALEMKRRAKMHQMAVQKKKLLAVKKGSKRHMMEFVIISVGVAVAASFYAFMKNDIILI